MASITKRPSKIDDAWEKFRTSNTCNAYKNAENKELFYELINEIVPKKNKVLEIEFSPTECEMLQNLKPKKLKKSDIELLKDISFALRSR